ncbi:MAG: type 4a pilus biogenesis protein PilO [Proteobacteria bacterium]|nr:type 4a pilus biogenesis protein PilO [Pseudomonadota bacterium]MBU1386417.1 type 4a pilus biogenesis protein PilO [Pseudomonadota bacterium]MBU1544528.1 type 4a pilus biogenesis protein PilO [Pseudomonadota bacterium]MBU2481018.1 type 4a pilus biogenesis protein PilO [Pseudomonadota bacterium]
MAEENQKITELKEKLNLVFEKIGTLTILQRLLICVATFALIGGAYYYFIIMPRYDQLKKLESTYQAQVNQLNIFKQRASQILKYEKLMAQKQEEFSIAMRALPDKRELPSLLTGISKAGSDAGLIFHLFQPDTEINREFYKEIPVSIKLEGKYHQITDFFYQISRLNRIVNINNVEVKSDKGGKSLVMTCKAVTYMFVEKKEPVDKNKRKRNKK